MVDSPGTNLRGREAARRVNQFRSSWVVFRRNYEELVSFLDYLCAPTVAFSYSPVEQKWLWHDGMHEVTRLLHNFVAAALSLIDHTRVLYRQLYEPDGLMPDYPLKVRTAFAEHPLTQFIVTLRHMAQHYRLPSLESHTEIEDVVNGVAGSVRIQLRLRSDDLRQFDRWNASAKLYLDSAGAHLDLKEVVTAYHDHVLAFYEWFGVHQLALHGAGPELLWRLSMHGPSFAPRREVEQLAAGVLKLEGIPRDKLTFGDLEEAFSSVLSILDTRRLLLCQHSLRVWVATALGAARSRFNLPPDLVARIHAIAEE
jgi:hypothetical protein